MKNKITSFLHENITISSHNSDMSDRSKAIELIAEHFGEENVIPISNFNQLQLRSLVKDLCRLDGVPFEEVNKYTRNIEIESINEAKKRPGFDAQQWTLTFEEAMDKSTTFRKLMKEYPELEKNITVLFKQMRVISRHAGGVLITENPGKNMPLIYGKGRVVQTPWAEGLNFRHLEGLGFLKFDLLGLGTLRMFENCIRRILKTEGIECPTFSQINDWFYNNLHPDNNSMDDMRVYKHIYWKGNWAGIFQFVQPPVQKFVMRMKPESITDLAAATSIYRPGPLCLSADTEILIEKNKSKKGNDLKSTSFKRKTIEQIYNEWNNPIPGARYKHKLTSLDEENNTLFRNNIKNVYKSGKKNVYKVKVRIKHSSPGAYVESIKNNKALFICKATLDHRFLTENGWKRLEDIEVGEYIYYLNRQIPQNDNRKYMRKENCWGQRNFNNIAFRNYKYECIFCDWDNASLDCNHIEGNRRTNNNPENLSWLCPNHHREFTEGHISKEELIEKREQKKILYNEDIRLVRFEGYEFVGEEETYDIEVEGPNHNFIAGSFIVHNSIGADKLYLSNRKNPDEIDYPHPLLKEVLGPTCGLIIFQEQLQLIYHKLAGVPLDETDGVRKAFTKKDKSNKEEGAKLREELKIEFVTRCKETNDIDEKISTKIFEDIEAFISYSFNKSHAVAYSITSYQCAYLASYYRDEWIATYIDYCATEKGQASGKESPISIALGEAKGLGYTIGKPDINISEDEYQARDKILIPSFRALKHVGMPALEEIRQYRPYKNIENILWNADETWRHRKLNVRALSTLIKLEAFDSLGIVGKDKQFKNYRQMYYVLVEKNEEFKRACARKKEPRPKELLEKYIDEAQELEDWTVAEKIEHSQKLAGTVNMNLIITPEVKKYLETQGIGSIDEWRDEKTHLWCVVKNSKIAKTKTGKDYLRLTIIGESGSELGCFVWGFDRNKHLPIENYTLILARFKKNDFGISTFFKGIEVISTR